MKPLKTKESFSFFICGCQCALCLCLYVCGYVKYMWECTFMCMHMHVVVRINILMLFEKCFLVSIML